MADVDPDHPESGGLLATGESIGPFRVRRRLGAGGMGVVYAAWDDGLQREVALKVLAPHLAEDEQFRARFTREARTQAGLDSANVVQVYSYGEEAGRLYIATQLVGDGDLGHLLRIGGPPPLVTALDLVAQVAAGVADAHAGGLIHRDIKPGNVLVRRRDDGLRAYVGDFGIARVSDAELTRSGAQIGTPAYMAPELHLGGEAGVATDVYSVGCLLWAVLVGQSPYGGTSEYQVVRAHIEGPVRQLVDTDPLLAAVNRVLGRSMAKRPEHRFGDAAALRDELRRLAQWAATAPAPRVVPVGPAGATPVGGGPSGPHSGPHSGPSYPGGLRAPSGPARPVAAPRRSSGVGPIVAVVLGAVLVGLTVIIGVAIGTADGEEAPGGTAGPSGSAGYDAADRQLAVDNLAESLAEAQPLALESVNVCAAERWIDDVGLATLVEERILTEDLGVDDSTRFEDTSPQVQESSERAVDVCVEEELAP